MSDSDGDEYDSDEVNEAYEEAKAGLRNGTVNCVNTDGTFRCPYSPGRKKQNYKYSEILQHAVGVGKGKRGAVPAGKHLALREYLEKDMAAKAQPQAERVVHLQQDIPSRMDSEDKRVCPWMGILQNIEIQARRPGDNFRIGAGAAEIKEKLKVFNPESVKVLYDVRGHLGVAIVEFQNSIDGFKDAEAFENSFYYERRGRKDFEHDYPNKCGKHLYGWMATKKDVESSNKLLSDHLKINGDLKSLPDIVKELERKVQQQVVVLKDGLAEKEDVLTKTSRENWNLTNKVDYVTSQREKAEREMQKLNEAHKLELEELRQAQFSAAEEHEKNMRAHRLETESRMLELENKISEHEKLKLESEAEKARNCEELEETQRLLSLLKGQIKQQQAQESKQIELIKKHKEESENLENQLQEQRKRLQAKQSRELESQRVTEQLETAKAKQAEIVNAKKEETQFEREIAQKRIAELEEKLVDLKDDYEGANELVNTLTISERQAKDEVADAKATILDSKVLLEYGTSEIGVKKLGELNTEGWYEVCKDYFVSPEAFMEWTSSMDEMLRRHTFRPLKMVPDGNGERKKYVVDEDDETLTKLRKTYGPIVANAVGAAALEIETWNPSGRYITPMPWDFNANKKATLSQVFDLVVKVLKRKVKELEEREKEIKQKDKQLMALLGKDKQLKAQTPAPSRKRGRS